MFDYRLQAAVAAIILAAAPNSGARAADLPSRAAPPPYVAVPAFTWTGFYVGVNAGAAFGGSQSGSFYDPTYGSGTVTGGSDTAFVGGGQVGYNYQFGAGSGFVVGLEADFQGVAGGSRATYAIGTVPYYDVTPNLDWFGTVRGRIGYAFDRLLVYGTGGFAYGGGSLPSIATTYPYTQADRTRTGYAVGGGVEYAFTPSISAKLEGLYVDLGRQNLTTYYDTGTAAYYGSTGRDSSFGLVRAGLNYRF